MSALCISTAKATIFGQNTHFLNPLQDSSIDHTLVSISYTILYTAAPKQLFATLVCISLRLWDGWNSHKCPMCTANTDINHPLLSVCMALEKGGQRGREEVGWNTQQTGKGWRGIKPTAGEIVNHLSAQEVDMYLHHVIICSVSKW